MSEYVWITYTEEDCGNGNTKIEYAEGILSYKYLGTFWIPTSTVDRTSAVKKRLKSILNTKDTIHLAYYTGELER